MGIWLDGYSGLTEKIKRAMYDLCRGYLYIGFLLDEAKRLEYYKEHGHKNIYEYAFKELNFKKSAVINFIAVYKEFSENGTLFLKDKYEKFNYSQLCEMLSLSEKHREKVSPNMTVKEIRTLKKEISDQTSGQIVYMGSNALNVRISSALHDRLAKYSEKSGFAVDLLVEQALATYLDTVSKLNEDAI